MAGRVIMNFVMVVSVFGRVMGVNVYVNMGGLEKVV